MRILILSNRAAGLFRFRRELLKALAQRHKVFVCVPDDTDVLELRCLGCNIEINKILERRGKNPFRDIQLLFYYLALIKVFRPDMVLTYTIKPNVYGGLACRMKNVPYIVNITGLGTSIENGGILQKISLLLYRMGLKNAQKIFFQNTANRDYFLARKIINAPYDLLPGSGVNLQQFHYAEYASDSNGIIFSTIGRIMKDKGIMEILAAAEILKKEYPNLTFRLIGIFDENFEKIIDHAQKRGIVEYISRQEDIRPWIKESHAVLHASYHEGMSNVLLEAAAMGRPVIATNVPGCMETFEEGVTGIGFKEKSTADLVRAVKEFLDLPHHKREEMGKKGREKMIREFDRRIVVDKYMREIEGTADVT